NAAILALELLPPDLGAKSGLEHFELARFRNEVVRSSAEALNHCSPVFHGSEHDQWDVPNDLCGFDPAASFLPSDTRHEQIEQDAIHGLDSQEFDGLLA